MKYDRRFHLLRDIIVHCTVECLSYIAIRNKNEMDVGMIDTRTRGTSMPPEHCNKATDDDTRSYHGQSIVSVALVVIVKHIVFLLVYRYIGIYTPETNPSTHLSKGGVSSEIHARGSRQQTQAFSATWESRQCVPNPRTIHIGVSPSLKVISGRHSQIGLPLTSLLYDYHQMSAPGYGCSRIYFK